ncbi:PhoX family protein [Pseudonocardia acidicola]|uniref:PhoX family protein n=1 Tax=Pseudonocardia acidicola TaxID=2724939 RepID=A0ABX1SKZ1_9PSEU|nr:PhoX family phosphatase [Pseudonocardia acidicola]NMI02231.1 PhoX family protein [Pseudonocardia acidicola]
MAQPCPDEPRPADGTPAAGLPLFSPGRPARQGLTCLYRCGNACSHEAPNTSPNEYFGQVLSRALSRRGALRAGAVLTLAAGAAGLPADTAEAATGTSAAGAAPAAPPARPPRGLEYETVAPNTADAVTVPAGYAQNVVIRWGDPVVPGAPAFDFENQTPEAQAGQFGYNNDFCGLVQLPGPGRRYLMFSNHEYTIEPLMFRGYDPANPTDEQIRIGMAAHGLSVVTVERDRRTGRMTVVLDERHNRRYTASSEFVFDGPAAGSALLRTSADPIGRTVLGTLNNCSGGVTPWGTFLSGEENVNQYFAGADPADPRHKRYGLRPGPSERKWERLEPRFDLAKEPNEVNRFGWVVEVDPQDPQAPPVKHTALGRFKHEGATIALTRDGRAVAYMGDDERFDYVYKFVSDARMMRGESRRAREHNRTLLSAGTLYVAKFSGDSPAAEIDGTGTLPADGAFDGSGEWIRLAQGSTSFVEGMSAEEVYVYTRQAADRVGATKMDRPEDVEPHPRTGSVYLALTNNSDRGKAGKAAPDEPNPRAGNKHGHVIELIERDRDPAATTFGWSILLVCGDPNDPGSYFGGYDKSQVSPISSPDNLAFDPYGNLWIATDSTQALSINDGLYGVSLEGPTRGRTTLFASVPIGAECCGPVVTGDFALISVQHPGDLDGASPQAPASRWPDGPGSQPRPSVVTIWRIGRNDRPGRIGQ